MISAEQKLAKTICRNEKTYGELLSKLILEGLIKLLEPIVYVRYLYSHVVASRKIKIWSLVFYPNAKRIFRRLLLVRASTAPSGRWTYVSMKDTL